MTEVRTSEEPPAAAAPEGESALADAPLRTWRFELAWAALYVPLAIAFTWPLTPRLGTHLAGDAGDGWQNLWNIAWLGRALGAGANPFFTPELFHPDGVTLVFQTFDLPDALWSAPLLAVLPPVTVYGLVVLWTFVGSGLSMFALQRGLGVARPWAFLAGCLFTFTTFHFGHARGHLHIIAMQWVPLFVLALWRLTERGSRRWAVAGGVFLALAALSSWYHLLSAMLLTAVLLPAGLVRGGPGAVRRSLPGALLLAGTFLALVGPLGVAMLRERAREPIAGSHQAGTFSADLESFAVPNAAQALSGLTDRHRRWTGNGAESASYPGWLLLGLVVAGVALRAPRVRPYAGAALVGLVISLGPALHVGGRVVTGDVLPYAWLERIFPLLQFTGVPVRLAFAATFGLAAAAGPTLAALAARLGPKWTFLLGALAVLEHAPNQYATSSFPVPAPLATWAADPERWAVLDATRDMRHLWHQIHHRHPIVGGYLTRTPQRLEDAVAQHPVAGPLLAWDAPSRTVPFTATTLDFDFATPPVPGAAPTQFSLDFSGTWVVAAAGEWTLSSLSDDGSEVFVDGRRVVDNGGSHEARERRGTVTVTAGPHTLRVRYQQDRGGARLLVRVQPPDGPARTLGATDVPDGFRGTARARVRRLAVPAAQALARLQADRIRYVIVDDGEPVHLLASELALPVVHVGEGVRIFEVPGGR